METAQIFLDKELLSREQRDREGYKKQPQTQKELSFWEVEAVSPAESGRLLE